MTPGKLVKFTESHLSLTELICGPRQGVYIEESTAHGKMLTRYASLWSEDSRWGSRAAKPMGCLQPVLRLP